MDIAFKELSGFVIKCAELEPNNAIYFQMPFEKGHLTAMLHAAGFKYDSDWYINSEDSEERILVGQQWIIRNKSSVPPQPSFTHTSRLLVVDKKGYVLLVQKGSVKTCPGGIADNAENPLVTAHREFQEEVGVTLNMNDFIQLAVLHRTPKADVHGFKDAGDTSFYYAHVVENKDDMKLKLQEKEISWAGWMHWSDVANSNEIGSHVKLMVAKIFTGTLSDKSLVYQLPDFHTLYKSPAKEIAAKTWNETMSMTMAKMPALIEIK